MDIEALTSFFMWCAIINGALLSIWVLLFTAAPSFVYRTQRKFFPLSQETFTTVFYSFLGMFKILYIIFILVPFIVLLIIK